MKVKQKEFEDRQKIFLMLSPLFLLPVIISIQISSVVFFAEWLFYSGVLALLISVAGLIVTWYLYVLCHMRHYYKVIDNHDITFFLRKDTFAFPMGNRREKCYLEYDYTPCKIESGQTINVDGEEVTVSPLSEWSPSSGDVFYCADNFDKELTKVIPEKYRSWHPYKILKVY